MTQLPRGRSDAALHRHRGLDCARADARSGVPDRARAPPRPAARGGRGTAGRRARHPRRRDVERVLGAGAGGRGRDRGAALADRARLSGTDGRPHGRAVADRRQLLRRGRAPRRSDHRGRPRRPDSRVRLGARARRRGGLRPSPARRAPSAGSGGAGGGLQVVAAGLDLEFPPLRLGQVEPTTAEATGKLQAEPPMRVVLAEDSVLLREGIARLLEDAGFEVVGQAAERRRADCSRCDRTAPTSRSSTSACRRPRPTRACRRRGASASSARHRRARPLAVYREAPMRSSSFPRAPRASAICSRTASPTSTVRRARCGAWGRAARARPRGRLAARRPAAPRRSRGRADAARTRGARADGRGTLESGDRGHARRPGRAVEKHVTSIFGKLRLPASPRRPPPRAGRAHVPALELNR